MTQMHLLPPGWELHFIHFMVLFFWPGSMLFTCHSTQLPLRPYGCCRWLQGPPPSTDLISFGSFLQKAGDLSVLPGQQSILLCRKRQIPSKKGRTIRTVVIDVGTVLRPFKCNSCFPTGSSSFSLHGPVRDPGP